MKTNLRKHFLTVEPTWISHLLLSDVDADLKESWDKLHDDETFDVENCDVNIEINGIPVIEEKLERFLNYMVGRYTEDLQRKSKEIDDLVIKKAKEFINDKLSDIENKLSDIENNFDWILEDLWKKEKS